MFFDDEINLWWCLGSTWRCTRSEAAGLWAVFLFYTTVLFATVIHSAFVSDNNNNNINSRTFVVSRRQQQTTRDDDDLRMLLLLLVYFFSFAAGSLLWVVAGVHWVHPVQIWQVQLFGSALLVSCAILFVAVHVNLGDNWSPVPEQKEGHQLVTHGVFRWARHPMYAIFLWAALGTFLATLNWLIAWIVIPSVMIMLRRIETEERILVDLFGPQYLEYRRRVSALGPPWRCLGFDRDLPTRHRSYQVIE